MDLSSTFRSLSKYESILLVLFIIYLIFDINPPDMFAAMVDSPLGMVVVLLLTLMNFMYSNVILGVVGLFVAYEVVRRSANVNNRVPMVMYTPSQMNKDIELVQMNPVQEKTLEEEMVEKMAPVGNSSLITYTMSEYKPVSTEIHNASAV
jgi:membrane protein implicated in regulation of membrane protease activity